MKNDNILAGRYCDLMVDVAFKRIFGQPANKDLLIALLGAVLPELMIKDLTFLNKEKSGRWDKSKKSVFDVLCQIDDGSEVIVEIQFNKQKNFRERVQFYAAQEILSQHKESDEEYALMPLYVVSFLNFELEHATIDPEKIIWNYSILENDCHERMSDAQHYTFIELPKFIKVENDLANMREKLLFCMRHMGTLKERPEGLTEAIFDRLFEQAEVARMTIDEYTEYLTNMMNKRDIANQIQYAKEEGMAEGKIETARNLKAEGIATEIITRCTGLTREQVQAL